MVAGVARAGPDDDEVDVVEQSSAPSASTASWRTTVELMPSTENTWASMFTKSSSPWRIAMVLPASDGAGGAPAWSVSQNFASRWLRESSAISTSSSSASSATSAGTPGAGGDEAERR